MNPNEDNKEFAPQAPSDSNIEGSDMPKVDVSVVDSSMADTTTNNNAFAAQQPVFPNKKSKKGLIIGIVAAVLVLLVGGGVGAMVWWTSPQNSFAGAMKNMEIPESGSANGQMVITQQTGGMAVTIDFDTKYAKTNSMTKLSLGADMGMMNLKLNGAVATKDDSLYFKVDDLRDTMTAFGATEEALGPEVKDFLDKLDNNYIEMTAKDFEDMAKESGEESGADMQCVVDTMKKVMTDKDYRKEALGSGNSSDYLSLEKSLGSEKVNGYDSNHLLVKVNKDKYEEAIKSQNDSKLMKDLADCGMKESEEAPESNFDKSTIPDTVEVWVDKWSHRITKMKMEQESNGAKVELTVSMDYKAQSVDEPNPSIPFKEIQADVEKLQTQVAPTTQSPNSELQFDSVY